MGHPPSFDARSVLSMTLPCPTRTLRARVALARRRPTHGGSSIPRLRCTMEYVRTYLFLELFVYCVQSILDRYALQVPRSDFETKREVQINLLDRRIGEKLFERVLLVKRRRGSIELPIPQGKSWLLALARCSRRVKLSSRRGEEIVLKTGIRTS